MTSKVEATRFPSRNTDIMGSSLSITRTGSVGLQVHGRNGNGLVQSQT